MEIPFYVVDVFAEKRYTGNQLAVFRNAGYLSTEQMLTLSQETNFQESTFILSDETRNGGYDVRIFTPEYEMPFAGHPTLGTAFVIKQMLGKDKAETVVLNLKIGQVPVSQEGETLWLRVSNPQFLTIFSAEEIAPLIGLKADDIDVNLPIEIVQTGVPFLIVKLKNLAAIKQLRFNADEVLTWMKAQKLHKSNAENGLSVSFFIFTDETESIDNQIHARMFCYENGIMREDPATGSANACLLAYLLKNVAPTIDLRVEQGYEMNRPSLLKIRGKKIENNYDLQVGGSVFSVAKGVWEV